MALADAEVRRRWWCSPPKPRGSSRWPSTTRKIPGSRRRELHAAAAGREALHVLQEPLFEKGSLQFRDGARLDGIEVAARQPESLEYFSLVTRSLTLSRLEHACAVHVGRVPCSLQGGFVIEGILGRTLSFCLRDYRFPH